MRNIKPAMVSWLDKKLKNSAAADHAIKTKDARLLFRLAVEACVGVKEATGRNDGPIVKLMQQTIGTAVNEPWCLSFLQTCIAYAEVKTGVKSPLYATEHCQTLWNKTKKSQRVKIHPLAGAIMVFADVGKSSGHVEMVLSADEKLVKCIGGNTSGSTKPSDPVIRDGNGVYYTVRSKKGTGKRKVLGYLKPF